MKSIYHKPSLDLDMKKYLKRIVCMLILLSSGYINAQELPKVNQDILDYCEHQMKKKVGNGECWTLAKEALNHAKADWTSPTNYGDIIDLNITTILPGDIIQFENVRVERADGYWFEFPHHTAVVQEVLSEGKLVMLHQNFSGVKKVDKFELDLKDVVKGELAFYRPRQSTVK